MKPDYLIQYPYSWQIGFLLLINIVLIIKYKDKIHWKKYRNVMAIAVTWGAVQINALENYTNYPAWYFPDGSSYWGALYGGFYWDDLFFIIVCSSLFYYFCYLTRHIKDTIPSKYYIWMISIFVILEAQLYHYCGNGAKELIIIYTLIPLIVFVFYCLIKEFKPNITQSMVVLCCIAAISVPWDGFAAVFSWWKYDIRSNAFLPREFFFKDRIPLGISPQYTIAGWVVMFSTYVIYGNSSK
ncbi:MAG: hypothetical protein V3V00_15990 [Saprospiraceae bacterium]